MNKIPRTAGFAAIACMLLPLAAAAAGSLAVSTPAAAGSPTPLVDFLQRDSFGTIKISPTGEYFAADIPQEGHDTLVVLRRSDLVATGHITLPRNIHVADFDWVNNRKVLFSVAEKQGELVTPGLTGELYAMDVDGHTHRGALVGPRADNAELRRVYAGLIDTLHNDDNDVLVSMTTTADYSEVDRMDVDDGHLRTVARAPVPRARFLADRAGVVRFAMGEGNDRRVRTFYRTGANADWELINDEAKTGLGVEPVGFASDGKTAYLQVEQSKGPDAIEAFDTATRERKPFYRDSSQSPAGYLKSPDDGSVFAAIFKGGKPSVHYLDPDNRYAKQLQAVQAGFPDAMVEPTSYSKDGGLAMYRVYSDRLPSDYYLLDHTASTLTFVVSRARWFTPEMLSEMRPVSFKARDGLRIDGYLTIPHGSDGRNLPMIINPHGGPFGIADDWGYNPEVQMLASRGYAVLQVNYRGSSGRGRDFLHAGYRQWGGKMQDDLTDATHWAIDQGYADPKRVCMYGASYGAYAALEGVTKEPSLYRCAIGYVGVYDLPAHYHLGDTHESKWGINYLKEVLGDTGLEAASPARLAANITVPVMMVAGAEDWRCPPKQTEMMRDALVKAGKTPDVKIYPGEGHGFYLEADRIDLYTRMLAFLDRNIGPSSNQSAQAVGTH